MKRFKDRCDNCGTWAYLRGFNGVCVCEDCIKTMQQKSEQKEVKDELVIHIVHFRNEKNKIEEAEQLALF